MKARRIASALAVLLVATACATTPSRPALSEFADIPVPNDLTYVPPRSTVIESPTVKAVRLVYRGRIEIESLAVSMRTTLEASGWRHLSSTTPSRQGVTQVYEKRGNTLQVLLWEGLWYTYVEVTASRALLPPR